MLPRNAQSVSEQKKRLEAAEIARSLSGHDKKNPGTEALGGAKIQKCSLWVCAHRRPTVGGAVKPWFSLSGKSLAMKLAVHTNYTTCCRGGTEPDGGIPHQLRSWTPSVIPEVSSKIPDFMIILELLRKMSRARKFTCNT